MLTNRQVNALEKINGFIQGSERFFLLTGYAGTGKTHVIMRIPGAVFTAPTHKAVSVLQKKTSSECMTIHSLLGLTMDTKEDKQVLKPEGKPKLKGVKIVVIDECSMIGSELFDFILKIPDHIKIIFSGDPAQLPPVGELYSKTFDIQNHAHLSEIIRQKKGSGIIDFSAAIRAALQTGGRVDVRKYLSNDVFLNSNMTEWFDDAFKSERYKQDPDAFRAVAWTNNTTQYYNSIVQGVSTMLFRPGDRAVTAGAVHETIYDAFESASVSRLALNTDTEGVVASCEPGFLPDFPTLPAWKIVFLPDTIQGKSFDLYIPIDAGVGNMLQKLAGEKNWREFWRLKKSVSDLRHPHALTVHRSQGSTFGTVFVDSADIMRNRNRSEALQCLYVAVTRASDNLILNSETI